MSFISVAFLIWHVYNSSSYNNVALNKGQSTLQMDIVICNTGGGIMEK